MRDVQSYCESRNASSGRTMLVQSAAAGVATIMNGFIAGSDDRLTRIDSANDYARVKASKKVALTSDPPSTSAQS